MRYHSADGSKPSTFKFEARRLEKDDVHFIKINHSENGVVAQNEIVNFYVNMFQPKPDTYSINFNLLSGFGKADIFIKECLEREDKCEITQADVRNSQHSKVKSFYPDRIFRFSSNDIAESDTVEDNLLLNVNCQGKVYIPEKQAFKVFKNKMPLSRTCHFVIGVFGRQKDNPYGAFYKLKAEGQSSHEVLRMDDQLSIKVAPGEALHYRVPLSKYNRQNASHAHFQIVTLTGAARLFFSKKNEYPNQYDNDSKVTLQNTNEYSIQSTTSSVNVAIDRNKETELYITIEAKEYTILNIYGSFEYGAKHDDKEAENIRISQIITRTLTKAHGERLEGGVVYHKSFFLQIPDDMTGDFDGVQINLHSLITGLKICVNKNVSSFRTDEDCWLDTENDVLVLPRSLYDFSPRDSFLITVLREVADDQEQDLLPIQFSISTASIDPKEDVALLLAGQSYTAQLSPMYSHKVSIDLAPMRHNAVVLLSSEDPTITSTLTMRHSGKELHALDFFKFGMRINDADSFKRQYCPEHCEILIEIFSLAGQNNRFSLTYTIDRVPIALKEGVVLAVPDCYAQYFIFEEKRGEPVSFDVASNGVKQVAYAKILRPIETKKRKIYKLVDSMKFDFKSDILNKIQLNIDSSVLKRYPNSMLGFLVEPKFLAKSSQKKIQYFDMLDQAKVVVHQRLLHLEGFNQIEDTVEEGEFKYFAIKLDRLHGFTLFLNSLVGHATLYLSEGTSHMPDTENFWLKSEEFGGQTLVVSAAKLQEGHHNQVRSFVIGVFGEELSHFTLLFNPDFDNLIKIQYQHLTSLTLAPNQHYYLDFFNKHEKYSTLLYAEDSDVEVAAMDFDQKKRTSFQEMIKNEDNFVQKFMFHKGDIPREHLSDHVVKLKTHIIVRFTALDQPADLFFAIFDKALPIVVNIEKRFKFVQKKEEVVFNFKLHAEFQEVDLDVKLDFGAVTVFISDNLDFAGPRLIDSPSQKYFTFKVQNRKEDIIIFKEVFVKVVSKASSGYSMLLKPKDKFKELKRYETEIVYTDPQNDQFLFYYINDARLKFIKELSFYIESINFFQRKPELLYMPDGKARLSQDSDFLPMQLLDLIENKEGEFNSLTVKPQINKGFFVIKLKATTIRIPVKISMSINGHRNIHVNGITQGQFKPDKRKGHQFSMFLPQKGEFRIVLESCQSLEVKDAVYTRQRKN